MILSTGFGCYPLRSIKLLTYLRYFYDLSYRKMTDAFNKAANRLENTRKNMNEKIQKLDTKTNEKIQELDQKIVYVENTIKQKTIEMDTVVKKIKDLLDKQKEGSTNDRTYQEAIQKQINQEREKYKHLKQDVNSDEKRLKRLVAERESILFELEKTTDRYQEKVDEASAKALKEFL